MGRGRKRKPPQLGEEPGAIQNPEPETNIAQPETDVERRFQMLETQLQSMATQNQMLLTMLQANGGITGQQEKEIVNNGWRVMLNTEHHNPDNMDWNPQLGGRRADVNNPNQDVPRELYTGDGKYEWGYKDPKTGKVIWSGKLLGTEPPGAPEEPPKPLEELRAELARR